MYEGIAWLASRFQDTQTEIRVLGKQLTVNPTSWKYKHHIQSNVGLGAGNNEKSVESLQGLYAIQQQLKANGSTLTDDVDIYNTLKRITDGLGFPRVDEFFNNPEEPEETLKAENEILNNMSSKSISGCTTLRGLCEMRILSFMPRTKAVFCNCVEYVISARLRPIAL